jgi:5-methylcytosine-specific restriction enzyme subunit McrC
MVEASRTRYSVKERSEITVPGLSRGDLGLLSQMESQGKLEIYESHGRVTLTTRQHVGVIGLSECVIEIEPKIDVRNLMYMLGVAERLDPSFFESTIEAPSQLGLYNFVVQLFLLMTEDLLRKGIWKSYETREEPLQVIRGRLMTKELATKTRGIPIPVWCRYDEYTANVFENHVIRYVLSLLERTELPNELDRTRRKLLSILSDVDLLPELYPVRIDAISYNRLNSAYRPVHGIGKLILQGLSFGEGVGAFRPYSFLFDMEQLFQEFVYSALRNEMEDSGTKVRRQSPHIVPKVVGPDNLQSMAVFPDILVQHAGKKVVLDTKWKKPFRDGRVPGSSALHPDNFHQMVSYITLHDAPGILLYPQEGEDAVEAQFETSGRPERRLHVRTINLDQGIEGVRREIAELSDYIRKIC